MISTYDPTSAYNDLPLLPPSGELETQRVLKLLVQARVSLERLNLACRLVPNASVLLRAIALQEAKLSSEIENIYTTHDELYRALSHAQNPTDPNAKEVMRYQDALWFGFNHVKSGEKIDRSLCVELARKIKQQMIDIRQKPGTQIANGQTGEIVYTPPEGAARIAAMMDNVCEYASRHDPTDPLVKMAVAHYQFEAIHPFPDGNGRTGRVLNILLLVQEGLLEWPVLYLSKYFIQNRKDYYAGLRGITEHGDWETWITFMLEGVHQTACSTHEKLEQIRSAVAVAIEQARERAPKAYSKELVELIFEQPYTRIPTLEARGIAKRQTASVYLQELCRAGLLTPHKSGRDMVFVNDSLLRILND